MVQTCPQLVKEYDDENQLKYVYYYDNKFSLVSKLLIIIISGVLLSFTPSIPYRIYSLLVILISVVLFNSLKINHQRSVSVNKHLGIEVKESSGFFHNNSQHRFIPSEQVIDVVINEGAYGLQFVFYLAVIVKELDKLVLILPETDLRLVHFEKLRTEIRRKLFEKVDE